jgi:hypothetical protein
MPGGTAVCGRMGASGICHGKSTGVCWLAVRFSKFLTHHNSNGF